MVIKSALSEKFKERIKRWAPWTSNIEIHVKKLARGLYESVVEIKAPGKVFVAHKAGKNVWDSLDRSTQAVYRQFNRYKRDPIHRKRGEV